MIRKGQVVEAQIAPQPCQLKQMTKSSEPVNRFAKTPTVKPTPIRQMLFFLLDCLPPPGMAQQLEILISEASFPIPGAPAFISTNGVHISAHPLEPVVETPQPTTQMNEIAVRIHLPRARHAGASNKDTGMHNKP